MSERFPAHQSQVAMLMRQSEVAAGNFDALLAELVIADAPRRRELEAMLARGLTDPAVLTESPVLPADHPLKRMARAVLDALTCSDHWPLTGRCTRESGRYSAALAARPWKLLVRALDAFYRHDNATVLANLSGIPPDSGPARLVPVLRRLVEKTACQQSARPPLPP